MQEFDPRRSPSRLASPVMAAVLGLALLGVGWKLTSAQTLSPPAPALDPQALAALQLQAFAQAEAQPGFARPENIEVKVRRGETLEAAVERAGVTPQDARDVVGVLGYKPSRSTLFRALQQLQKDREIAIRDHSAGGSLTRYRKLKP